MSQFPAGKWKVVGWGMSVAGDAGAVEVEHVSQANDAHDAIAQAMRTERWSIYAPVKIVSVQRLPPRPPHISFSMTDPTP